jgi:uncharacterized membrane protein
MKTADIILIITTVVTGLIAGLFYAFSYSVVLGLGKLPDAEYIRAFQNINREIQNPVFLSCFMGILLLLPLSTYLHYQKPATPQFWLLLAATLVYFIGVFAVTAIGNIPLNNAIDALKLDGASAESIQAQRSAFESKWNNLNIVRTIASTVTLILTVIACLRK